jgi:hypothetical protein
MGPLLEALVIFVGIPAITLAAMAIAIYAMVVAMSHLTGRAAHATAPASPNVVAFPGVRPIVVARNDEDARRAA